MYIDDSDDPYAYQEQEDDFGVPDWQWGDPGYDPNDPPPDTFPFSPSFGQPIPTIDPPLIGPAPATPSPAPAPSAPSGGDGRRSAPDLGPLLQGFSGKFTPPPFGDAFTKLSSLLGPAPTFSARPVPTLENYTPTTTADLYADPSFDFRKGIGEKALLNSKAAQGLTRTGGTLKDLIDYNSNFASQEFGNVDARRFRDHLANRQNTLDVYDRGFEQDRAAFEPKLFEWSTKGTLGARAEENAYDNAFNAFQNDFNMYRDTQRDIFERLKWASEFGLDSATR